jgi:hypothetical protein
MRKRAISAVAILVLTFATVAAQDERWLTDALHAAKINSKGLYLGVTEAF